MRQVFHRRILLELWAIFILACVIGFMGPFGTYVRQDLADRIWQWWLLLMGAYIIVRPVILLLRKVASSAELAVSPVMFWGVSLSSFPLAVLWRNVGEAQFGETGDYSALLPFSLLCSLGVLGVAQWAGRLDRRLHLNRSRHRPIKVAENDANAAPADDPPLRMRLPPDFQGPILALQSEDHYVRVHGEKRSALVLIRLRDAIAEMGDVPGEQVHRSWWVARRGIAKLEPLGRSWIIQLENGEQVPVARDSVTRLRNAGLLPNGSG